MCAKNATPPPASGCRIEKPPSQSWNTNQMPRNQTAGISRKKIRMKKNSRQHARARQEQEVGAEHAGDRAGRADVRDARALGARELERDERLQRHRGEPGRRGTRGGSAPCPSASSTLLPKIQRKSMLPPTWSQLAVHEHRGERALVPGQLVHRRERREARAAERARVVAVVEDLARRRRPPLPEPDDDVRHDQPHGDERERPRRDVVLERQHAAGGYGSRAPAAPSARAGGSRPGPRPPTAARRARPR